MEDKLIHVQTVVSKKMLEDLKKKTGEFTTKDALYVAIKHYLECPMVKPKKKKKEK